MRLAVVFLLSLTATPATGEIVWRLYCPVQGKGMRFMDLAYDSSRECHDYVTDVAVAAELGCKAGTFAREGIWRAGSADKAKVGAPCGCSLPC